MIHRAMTSSSKIRILIFEESNSDFDLIQRHAASDLYDSTIQQITTKEELISALNANSCDIFIVNFNLVHYDVLQLMQLAQSFISEIPIVVYFDHSLMDIPEELFNSGARDFITKSFLAKLPFIIRREFETFTAKRQQMRSWDMLIHNEEMLTRSQTLAQIGHFEIIYPINRILWSLEMYKILGYSYGESVTEEKLFERFSPIDQEKMPKIWQSLKSEETKYDLTITLALPKSSKQGHLVIESEFLEEGSLRIFGTLHDVTNYSALEVAKIHNEHLFKGIFNNSSQIIILLDLNGRILKMNQQSLEIFGVQEYTVQGLDIISTLFGQERSEIKFELAEAIRMVGPTNSVEVFAAFQSNSGKKIFLDCDFSAVNDPSGEVLYLLFEGKDITEKIELERLYAQAHKMEALGTFAGTIAHDFNNLLTPMFNYLSILNIYFDKDSTKMENNGHSLAMGGLEKSLQRAKSLVGQILDFGKKDSIELEEIDLVSTIHSITSEVKSSQGIEHTLILNLNLPKAIIIAHPTYLYQIISNLYHNALSAMDRKSDPRITIELTNFSKDKSEDENHPLLNKNTYYQLSFADNGVGILPENLVKIFEPFYTTKGTQGTGLGLPIVYGNMRKLGGLVTAKSEPGVGTSFYCYFDIPF
jgi:PAS domain S-box-containing protein